MSGRAWSAVVLLLGAWTGLTSRDALAQPTVADEPAPSSAQRPADGESSKPSVVDTWGTTETVKPDKADLTAGSPRAAVSSAATKDTPASSGELSETPPNLDSSSTTQPHLRYTLERIEVRGNHRTLTRVILRYLKFKPGDILDV